MTKAKPRIWFGYPKLKPIAFHVHRWLGLTAGRWLG